MASSFSVALGLVMAAGTAIGLTIDLSFGRTGTTSMSSVSRNFDLCHTGGGTNCVVDGDTIWFDGERVRLMDIDTPETHPPRCAEEAQLGRRATLRLQALLNEGPVELISDGRDADRFGRKLRVVSRNGESLGERLIAEGLARPWEGRRRPWCVTA